MSSNTQKSLASYFHAQAEWRRAKEDEYGDPRNLAAAGALDELADYVLSLPNDDPRIVAISGIATDWDTEALERSGIDGGLEVPNPDASRIGFTGKPISPSRELTSYVRGNLEEMIRTFDPSIYDGDDGEDILSRLQTIQLELLRELAG